MKKAVKKAAPKKAAPKKKVAPAKGAWTPPWAKKEVKEKKTGEKYASKAAMAKHEKGESKKMRMMEGEIPMAKKGGKAKKSCSCGKASCMMCGGKKYQYGGRNSNEETPPKGPMFNANNAATADSTNYYKGKSMFLNDAVNANLKAGNLKGSIDAIKARNKANKDRLRQNNKGKSGYDSNGFPAKVMSRGGKVTKMKKAAPVTKMKRGGKK